MKNLLFLVSFSTCQLYSFNVIYGVAFLAKIRFNQCDTQEDCAFYCAEFEECDGFSYDGTLGLCTIFNKTNDFIYYTASSTVFFKINICGATNLSNFANVWSANYIYSNCTADCGMYGLMNKSRIWMPDIELYNDTIYGPTLVEQIHCPSQVCHTAGVKACATGSNYTLVNNEFVCVWTT